MIEWYKLGASKGCISVNVYFVGDCIVNVVCNLYAAWVAKVMCPTVKFVRFDLSIVIVLVFSMVWI